MFVPNGSDTALGDNDSVEFEEGDVSDEDDLAQLIDQVERHCIAHDQAVDKDEGDTDELLAAMADRRTNARSIRAPKRFR